MENALRLIALLFLAAHLGALAAAVRYSRQRSSARPWLLALIAFAAVACAVYLIPDDTRVEERIGRGLPLALTMIAAIAACGGLIIQDMVAPDRQQRTMRPWFAAVSAWFLIVLASALISDAPAVTQANWLSGLFEAPDASVFAVLIGWLVMGGALLAIGFQRFYLAALPEIANRALYWVMVAALLVLAALIVVSGTDLVGHIGLGLLLTACAGAIYGTRVHRVFDVRAAIILAVRNLIFIGVATALILVALYLVAGLAIDNTERLLLLVGLSLLIAVVLVPARQLIDAFIQQITTRDTLDAVAVAREYNKQVSENVELEPLVEMATQTLNRVLRVRRSCVILLNRNIGDSIEFLVMQPGGEKDRATGRVSVHSPIYEWLAAKRRPLTQFDIEYDPRFKSVPESERQFFRDVGMSAYAPIVLELTMNGLLAAGPMINDTAYYERDLEVLTTLAQQTGVALRNARLLDDLQHLNRSMQSLNRSLRGANDQLNKLDSVKSDFVTIASHELRTPLAQIRGYTDIIDALNDQGMLDPTQTTSLVGNLRKATERMEELIAAMLDVSQLDVNAMDLRFTETPPESVLRMAIEPLTDAIKQRKLTLSARGLRGLPNIQADLPRLVQAFRNVIVNAIKFTPDGGRIEIIASHKPAEAEDGMDQVLVEIRDTGVGIEAKNLELVFKKFFRGYDPSLHSTGTYKFLGAGPGLGLTIAKGVIESHGGRIWAESPGHDMEQFPGTTFFVLLPVGMPSDTRRTVTFEADTNGKRPSEQTSRRPMVTTAQPDQSARS
jgi:signal transduction histidine kinase